MTTIKSTIRDEHGNALDHNSEAVYQAAHDLLLRIDRLMQDHDPFLPDDVRDEFRKGRTAVGRSRAITGRALDEFNRQRRQAAYASRRSS